MGKLLSEKESSSKNHQLQKISPYNKLLTDGSNSSIFSIKYNKKKSKNHYQPKLKCSQIHSNCSLQNAQSIEEKIIPIPTTGYSFPFSIQFIYLKLEKRKTALLPSMAKKVINVEGCKMTSIARKQKHIQLQKWRNE